jgi:ABC-type sugar transport system ATPase subunit
MTPLLDVTDLRKSYGGVQAVRGVSFSLNSGEVVAVVGDNGAGKSTTIKMVSGAVRRDHGTIRWEGRDVDIGSPDDARGLGIETMYQDLALVPDLDVAANVFLGREPMKRLLGVLPVLDREGMRTRARALLDRVNIRIPSLDQPVRSLSGGQRQATAIARFLLNERPRLIIMDEPTAALGVQEQRKVMDLIRTLKEQGITILVISHNLEHVFEVCERIIVLRAGQVEGMVRTSEVSKQAVVSLVMGGGRA